MTDLLEVLSRLEENGGSLRLEGDRIRYSVPSVSKEALDLLAELRKHRDAVRALLIERAARQDGNPSSQTSHVVLAMPAGVRLVHWDLKEPPVAIDTCSVVTDPALFAHSTLEQLRAALAEPKRWVGWSVPQLIDRLAQVGVTVTLESEEKLDEADHHERNDKRLKDPHQELVRAMLAKVSDQPVGMVQWLGENRPMLYEELVVQLPDKIHQAWVGRAPLAEFERILDLWLEAYRTGYKMYRGACGGRREERE